MRRQARPFIVEVKRRRASSRRKQSIWGDLDLSAVAAETTTEPETSGLVERPFVDSDGPSIDVVANHNLEGEHHMADPQETEAVEPPAEVPAVAAPDAKKRTPRQKRAKAQTGRPARKAGNKSGTKAADAPAATVRAGRRAYSQQERMQKLGQIETSVGRGETLKSAIKQAGISEQTYYHWKRAAKSATPTGDLKDLVTLEEENERLKKLLAERLRKENADLRKKLGMA